jgi:glycosyltransferase involved in cell wall biosynthesis
VRAQAACIGELDAVLIGSREQAPHSVYEAFRRHLSTETIAYPAQAGLPRIGRSEPPRGRRLLAMRARALGSLTRHPETPHHVLYADSDLRVLAGVRRAGRPAVIGTFHKPAPELERLGLGAEILHSLTAVVLVSDSQRDYFADCYPTERTFVVPRGVDTDFYSPTRVITTAPHILVAGSGHLDLGTLGAALDTVCTEIRDVVVLAMGAPRVEATRCTVERFPTADEGIRRAAHARARVAVFSFLHCTASAELLEAMASGLPIVATDVGGVREYVGDTALLCAPGDAEAFAEAVIGVLRDDRLAARLGRAARSRALDFDLRKTAERHRAVYRWSCEAEVIRSGRSRIG